MTEINPLPLFWAGIIGFFIVMYVVLDGFTLGIGLLISILTKEESSIAQSVILPTWDGNQTWLVLGGASLYGAFPVAFATLMPIFYAQIIVMILALLLRGVVFEFRLKTNNPKRWDIVFTIASLIVILCQGVLLGNFIQGFQQINGKLFSAHMLTPFVCLCALGLIIGYGLLGSTRLILKTTGSLRDKMYFVSKILSWGVIILLALVSLYTPYIDSHVYSRWFAQGHWVYLFILPYLSGLLFIGLQISLYKRIDKLPFYAAIFIFICGYIGFIISIFPYMIPYQKTIWQCASPDNTLTFLLFGTVLMIPILLIYTGYAYHIFKDKVTDVISY